MRAFPRTRGENASSLHLLPPACPPCSTSLEDIKRKWYRAWYFTKIMLVSRDTGNWLKGQHPYHAYCFSWHLKNTHLYQQHLLIAVNEGKAREDTSNSYFFTPETQTPQFPPKWHTSSPENIGCGCQSTCRFAWLVLGCVCFFFLNPLPERLSRPKGTGCPTEV